MSAGLRLVLASVINIWMGAALLFPGERGRPILVGLAPTVPLRSPLQGPPAERRSAVTDSALAEMTADDVTRGVWALSANGDAPTLTAEQRDQLRPLVATGARLRTDLGRRRTELRAAEQALLVDGVHLVEVLGPDRAAALAPAAPTGAPPRRGRE